MDILSFNIMDFIICGILALSMISGMYKGFIASGLAAVGFVAAWFGALNLFPQLATAVQSNSSLMSVLSYYLDASSLFKTRAIAEAGVEGAVQSGVLTQALEELQLPTAIETAFQNNVSNQLFANLNLNTFAEYLNQTIWGAAINILAFLVMFAISYVVVLLIVNLLNNMIHFPLLKHFDWLLGGVFGLARGVVVVMLLLAVTPLVLSLVPLDIVQSLLNESALAAYFPQNFAIPNVIAMAFQ